LFLPRPPGAPAPARPRAPAPPLPASVATCARRFSWALARGLPPLLAPRPRAQPLRRVGPAPRGLSPSVFARGCPALPSLALASCRFKSGPRLCPLLWWRLPLLALPRPAPRPVAVGPRPPFPAAIAPSASLGLLLVLLSWPVPLPPAPLFRPASPLLGLPACRPPRRVLAGPASRPCWVPSLPCRWLARGPLPCLAVAPPPGAPTPAPPRLRSASRWCQPLRRGLPASRRDAPGRPRCCGPRIRPPFLPPRCLVAPCSPSCLLRGPPAPRLRLVLPRGRLLLARPPPLVSGLPRARPRLALRRVSLSLSGHGPVPLRLAPSLPVGLPRCPLAASLSVLLVPAFLFCGFVPRAPSRRSVAAALPLARLVSAAFVCRVSRARPAFGLVAVSVLGPPSLGSVARLGLSCVVWCVVLVCCCCLALGSRGSSCSRVPRPLSSVVGLCSGLSRRCAALLPPTRARPVLRSPVAFCPSPPFRGRLAALAGLLRPFPLPLFAPLVFAAPWAGLPPSPGRCALAWVRVLGARPCPPLWPALALRAALVIFPAPASHPAPHAPAPPHPVWCPLLHPVRCQAPLAGARCRCARLCPRLTPPARAASGPLVGPRRPAAFWGLCFPPFVGFAPVPPPRPWPVAPALRALPVACDFRRAPRPPRLPGACCRASSSPPPPAACCSAPFLPSPLPCRASLPCPSVFLRLVFRRAGGHCWLVSGFLPPALLLLECEPRNCRQQEPLAQSPER